MCVHRCYNNSGFKLSGKVPLDLALLNFGLCVCVHVCIFYSLMDTYIPRKYIHIYIYVYRVCVCLSVCLCLHFHMHLPSLIILLTLLWWVLLDLLWSPLEVEMLIPY